MSQALCLNYRRHFPSATSTRRQPLRGLRDRFLLPFMLGGLGLSSTVGAAAIDFPPPQISANANHAMLLTADGRLYAWGENRGAQLGLGDTLDRPAPVQVGIDTDWIAVGSGHLSVAQKRDGRLYSWGRIGNTEFRYAPALVSDDADWSEFSVADGHALARKVDGRLYAWGYNTSGQLGLGDEANRSSPVQIGSSNTWGGVSTGRSHSFALQPNGILYAWGRNWYCQLGVDDTIHDHLSPVRVSGSRWAKVDGGDGHSLGVRENGQLFAWGDSSWGALGLGDGLPDRVRTPMQVGTDKNWAAVSAGYFHHSLALKKNGTLYAWGLNSSGQLGLSNTKDRYTPVKVGSSHEWAEVAAGYYASFGRKLDGSLWAWGRNYRGQLGLGIDAVDQQFNRPAQIAADAHIPLGRLPFRHNFGSIAQGTNPVQRIFTLTNNDIQGRDFLVSAIGTRGAGFSVSHDCPAALPPGQSCTAIAYFDPSGVSGLSEGAIAIQTPSVITGEVTLELKGRSKTPSGG